MYDIHCNIYIYYIYNYFMYTYIYVCVYIYIYNSIGTTKALAEISGPGSSMLTLPGLPVFPPRAALPPLLLAPLRPPSATRSTLW